MIAHSIRGGGRRRNRTRRLIQPLLRLAQRKGPLGHDGMGGS